MFHTITVLYEFEKKFFQIQTSLCSPDDALIVRKIYSEFIVFVFFFIKLTKSL